MCICCKFFINDKEVSGRLVRQVDWSYLSQLPPDATSNGEDSAMTKNDQRLRKMLETERRELLDAISHYEVLARQKKPGLGNHMADDGTEAFDQAASLALHRNEQILLSQVEAALTRMDKGVYGACERCGNEIDFDRLVAVPYAELCIRCQLYVEEAPRGNGTKR